MPVVDNTVETLGPLLTNVTVTSQLVAVRYRTSDLNTILAPGPSTSVSHAGAPSLDWALTLEANSLLTPAGTYWQIAETVTFITNGGVLVTPNVQNTYSVLMPVGGGPYSVWSILTAVPGDSGPAAGAVRVGPADNAATAGAMRFGAGTGTLGHVADVRSADGLVGALQVKHAPGGAATNHAVNVWQAGTSGTGSALNVTSDNPDTSAVGVRGHESGKGVVKVTHEKPAGVADASSSALAIDLVPPASAPGEGTAAQGIALITSAGPTTGNLILCRNNGVDDFVVKGTGRVGIGVASGATPSGMLDIRPTDTTVKALFAKAFAAGASLVELRDSADVAQLDVDNAGRIRWKLAPRWNDAALGQTTVGAAGGASAPPATPVEYLDVVRPGGSVGVIPVYLP